MAKQQSMATFISLLLSSKLRRGAGVPSCLVAYERIQRASCSRCSHSSFTGIDTVISLESYQN